MGSTLRTHRREGGHAWECLRSVNRPVEVLPPFRDAHPEPALAR
jgi:hypothetical protein